MTAPSITPSATTDFSDAEQAIIEKLLGEINLASTATITAFGNVSSASATIEALASLMEQAPTALLAGKIAEIVAKLGEADPRQVAAKPGWFARFTGGDLEVKVRYQVSRKSVETLLGEANRLCERVTRADPRGRDAGPDSTARHLFNGHAGGRRRRRHDGFQSVGCRGATAQERVQ